MTYSHWMCQGGLIIDSYYFTLHMLGFYTIEQYEVLPVNLEAENRLAKIYTVEAWRRMR